MEWIEDNLNVKIPFPIIADTGNVAMQLGMIHPNKASNTVRAVFIVDPDAKIRLIIYYPQEIGRSIDEVLRALKALQYTDKNHVAAPENWPNNDFLQDRVIIPPAADYKTAMERKKKVGRARTATTGGSAPRRSESSKPLSLKPLLSFFTFPGTARISAR